MIGKLGGVQVRGRHGGLRVLVLVAGPRTVEEHLAEFSKSWPRSVHVNVIESKFPVEQPATAEIQVHNKAKRKRSGPAPISFT